MKNSPHLDRWHYLDFRDGKHDKNYIEWKYFNFIQKDLAGYMVYYVLDPEKKTSHGGGKLLAKIFKDGKSFGALRKIDMNQIRHDSESASTLMDDASIKEVSPYRYDISGTVNNLSWSLEYNQVAPTIESFRDVNSGLMRWEKMSWLVKMPRAKVTGEIRTNDNIFSVDGMGYSDTNWGEFLPLLSRYEWGQYNDENLSFVFGVLYGLKKIKKGYFYFIVDNKVTALESAIWNIDHVSWISSKEGIKIPNKTNFVIREGEYTVRISSELIQYDTLGLKIGSLFPKSIVSEQLVRYDGTIEKKGILIKRFNGVGFEEWSTRTWKPISLSF